MIVIIIIIYLIIIVSLLCRFEKARPGLVVSVFPFREDDMLHVPTSKIAYSIPVVHLKEIFLFGTTVATRVPV